MTEKQKQKIDNEMMNLWQKFIYEKAMCGSQRDYRHLDSIIRDGLFKRRYVQSGRKISGYWIFILCDGEFGYFDGYTLEHKIPVALAKLCDVEDILSRPDFIIKDGYYLVSRIISR